MIKTIEYTDGIVRMIDQTKLPREEVYVEYRDYKDVSDAIRNMLIRGAPAIGVAAAMGVSLGANEIKADNYESFLPKFQQICDLLAGSRPTAVNLFWAIKRMKKILEDSREKPVDEIKKILKAEAIKIWKEDIAINKSMGKHGQELIKDGDAILTHCNAGALATAGYGTALGVIRAAWNAGKKINVLANETRPFLQGARLTAWELKKENIPVKLITDSMAGHFMKKKEINLVIVGADRIASNGDVANKIGTYTVAILAREHQIPFYVAAPLSTLDMTLSSGEQIPIEERSHEEVTRINNKNIAPEGIDVAHPAFDVTPNKWVNAIITEKGIVLPPFKENLKKLF
ncbi:MAG: S-methyl-5-thioribose-1-phosphate isomerase [Nitrospinota bacterium]|nr:S-methyl-5-thioribose-1-phosphate isomerase [Nitrospinota bacterium]